MDFLNEIAQPQSAQNMELLRYLLILSYIIFIPYLSVLTGSTILSLFYDWKGRKDSNSQHWRFARDLVDLVTFNKSLVFGLGVVPFLSIIFTYSQLLKGSPINVAGYLLFALLLFVCSVVFIYTYKHSFHLKEIFEKTKENIPAEDVNLKNEFYNYSSTANRLYNKTGIPGLVLLLMSSYFIIGSLQFISTSSAWGEVNEFVVIVLSFATVVNYVSFLLATFTITAASILYVLFRPNAGIQFDEENYKSYLTKNILRIGLIFTLLQPLGVALSVLTTNSEALSASYFGITLLILFILFLLSHFFYSMLKTNEIKYSTMIIFFFVLLVCLGVYKDQVAFENSANQHFQVLAADYEVYEKELKESLGLLRVEVNGEDIYKGRCLACHQFDKKVVGPPYNETLVKYDGKFEDLVDFILNPKKIDPEYPAMPAQGLKPNEAEAVAEYIVNTYNQQQGEK